jgi:hypothetical protein
MKWLESRVLWGTVLILGGVLFLLQNMNILRVGDLFWVIAFGLIGVYILSIYFVNHANWWALIPGIVLIDLAAVIAFNLFLPGPNNSWTGSLFLGGIGLAFWLVYLNNRSFWWAIIPGGVLFTLAIVAGVAEIVPGLETGGIFFLGLGATFALVAVLPAGEGVQPRALRWAFIPAGVLVIMGVLITAASSSLINYIWPVVLILGGIYLVYRTVLSRRV